MLARTLSTAARRLATRGVATSVAQPAADRIKELAPNASPRLGIVLGSGMGQIADSIENPVAINYADIPDFPRSSVSGHAGQLVLGTLQGVEVACFQGRVHMYEGVDPQALRIPTYALKLIGCDTLLLTTAVGSTRMESGPGSLVAITDHINLQARNPLIGPNDPIGDRFPSLLDAYDPELRAKLHEAASESDVTLRDGVYLANLGPSFETPAEIRAASVLGADVVGMSTVSEVICARHCGMKVAAIAVVVNYAAGLGDGHITHDETLHFTGQAADNVQSVVDSWIKKL